MQPSGDIVPQEVVARPEGGSIVCLSELLAAAHRFCWLKGAITILAMVIVSVVAALPLAAMFMPLI